MNFTNISWTHFLAAGATLAVLTFAINLIDIPQVEAKANPQIFDLEAHRGGRDARPENTLVSFAYALELGVTTLEMDMQLTKDDQIVISHNPIMNANLTKGPDGNYVKAGQYDIRKMTLKEIKQFDVGTMNPNAGDYYESHGKTQLSVPGTKIPTLEEVFELANSYGNDKIYFNLETKSYADPADPNHANNADPEKFVKKFYEIVKKYHMEDRVFLQSFDWRTLKIMHNIDPTITLVALSSEQPSWGYVDGCYLKIGDKNASPWLAGLNINDYHGDYVKAAKAIGADVVSPYWEELSPQLVSEAHELGMKVVPWTVNSPKSMNMLIDMGVDGIISDKPWILRDLLIKRDISVAEPTINSNSPYHIGTNIIDVETKKLSKGGDSAE
ncbi:glycerophosphodiester phosphodiesterase [Pelosinus sp. UFO1]|uniref:glycerophosphodiester phosphodiesterase n=1 Tax=Pelosinus sp. UFO1 TaxID=484770 RepID=UPI0004D0E573|nr:glycerophosphodiester phosphodiesterase [Pelosinus sp. UFO1]AIF49969.1 glycerophosphoryl diester phosphodiesterase [Pelosinus sp. UFO1]